MVNRCTNDRERKGLLRAILPSGEASQRGLERNFTGILGYNR